MKLPVYLDNNATTQIDPRVLDAMLPYLKEDFGNASSLSHTYGIVAAQAVEISRNKIARFFNTETNNIIFTSCATESINFALQGTIESFFPKKNHIISSTIEHHATLNTLQYLQAKGIDVTYIRVNSEGFIDLDALEKSITPKTALVTLIAANNEIGTIQDIDRLAKIAMEKEVLLHLDFSQATGKVAIDLSKIPVAFLSISAHKIYGPKGIGALIVDRNLVKDHIIPLIHGGGQEKNMRGGTLNVPFIVALGRAIEIINENSADENKTTGLLRDRLFDGLCNKLNDVYINGPQENRLVNNLNVLFKNVNSDTLLMNIRSIACSNTSACSTGNPEPSHVLRAIGRSVVDAKSSLRFGIGRFNTMEDIDYAVETISEAVLKIRQNL